ncbi:MAG: acyl-CoA dehydrogenase C-terminal domain-containing protein [Sandaracinaceae bacterium]
MPAASTRRNFFADIAKLVGKHGEHPVLGKAIGQLAKAQEAVGGAAFQLLGWFKGGEMHKVPLNANLFLTMMSEVSVGWLLLEGAVIAHEKQAELAEDHPDWAFYAGKKAAALYWANNVLPGVVGSSKVMQLGDRSPLDIPDGAFATV